MSASIKRYLTAFHTSQTFADQIKISQYPVNMFDILKLNRLNHRILVASFSDYKIWAKQAGWDCPDKLKDAKCYLRPEIGIYLIIYNEKKPQLRINFSLAHELAHIVLGHLNDGRTEIDRGSLDDITYFAMEGAANTFGGNFLAPPILIHEFIAGGFYDIKAVAAQFGLSKAAVQEYRKQDYQYWLNLPHNECELRILDRCKWQFHAFFCFHCSNLFSIENAQYCPICGNHIVHIRKEFEKNMGRIFPSIELTQSGRVKECLVCENEEHADDATFCIICGKPVLNQCLSAISDEEYGSCRYSEPLAGNARYCPYCGSKTTFFQSGILPDWTKVPKGTSAPASIFTNSSNSDDDDFDLPF